VHYAQVVNGPSRFIYLKNRETLDPAQNDCDTKDFTPPIEHNYFEPRNDRSSSDTWKTSANNDSGSGSVVIHGGGSCNIPIDRLDENPIEDPFKDQYTNPPKSHSRTPLSHRDGSLASVDSFGPGINQLDMYTQVDSLDCATSPKSRKRSAKTASLPDSIPPDDEGIESRRKLLMTELDLQSSGPILESLQAGKRPTFSFIPMSVSLPAGLEKEDFSLENSPLPDFAQAFESKIKGFDFTETPTTNPEGFKVHSLPDYETPMLSPESSFSKSDKNNTGSLPDKGADANLPTEENIAIRDDDNLSESLRVCNGSLAETGDTDETDGSQHEPSLVLEGGIVYFQTPPDAQPMKYRICVTFEVILRKGKSLDWWELDLRGLPQLGSSESSFPESGGSESGYLYFRTTPNQGMEYGTSPFKRSVVVENCLMAQFTTGKSILGRNLVIPLRKCSAEHYGFIHNYKINSVLRLNMPEVADSEVEGAEFGESSSRALLYTALCSIDLINHAFCSQQCSFHIYLHGGPEGKYYGHLEESDSGPPCLLLNLASDARIGVSHIEITCPPEILKFFALQWESHIPVPWGKAVIMPRIKNTEDGGPEIDLQNKFALGEQYVPPMPTSPQSPCTYAESQTSPFSESRISEELKKVPTKKSKKARHILGGLGRRTWASIKFLFDVFCFLASLHTLYLSYILVSHGCTELTSPYCRNGLFMTYVHALFHPQVNTTDNYNVTNLTYTSPVQEVTLPMIEEPEFVHAETQNNGTMPLRDRIDYFLGWTGPVVRGRY
jgi:hypothetical protein